MNRWIYFAPAFLVLAIGGLFLYVMVADIDTKNIPTPLKDKALPEFALPSVHDPDEILRNTNLSDQPYLLNVWATWCITCRVEHPVLYRLAQDEGVKFIGLNYKDSRDEAIDWLAEYNDPFSKNIYDEEGTLGFDLGVTGAPETFFVRGDGTVAYKHVGEIDYDNWNNKLKAIYESL